jgi:uncharacterized protein (TIGR02271 family)
MADPNVMNSPSLSRLNDADYDVAPGQPDVRGWSVVTGNDEKVGEIDDLIIEPAAGKVRYIDVDLDRKALGLDRGRHVLVPIGSAQLDRERKHVVLSGMSRIALLKMPEYEGKSFASGYDDTFRSHLSKDFESKRITEAAEELRIGKRAEKKGEVRVSKHVETEHVKKTVPVEREEVRVERRPVEHAVGSASELRDQEISVPVTEEQVVVEKRPVVKEEVIISKERVPSEETIETDVRREKVDVHPSSGNIRVKDDMKGRGGK